MAKVRINWESAPDGTTVNLYEVYNTAHKSLLVLALDRSTALEIAYNANHIHFIWNRRDKSYPHVAEVRALSTHRTVANCLAAIQIAIAQRLQGTVHSEGDKVCIGSQVVVDQRASNYVSEAHKQPKAGAIHDPVER